MAGSQRAGVLRGDRGSCLAGGSGRPNGFSVDAGYTVGYHYDDVGRLERVTGPGLPTHGALYSRLDGSEMVEYLRYQSGEATTLASVRRGYLPDRDLVEYVENARVASPAATISKYDYVYDALGRRTAVANSGTAFSGEAFNLWGYNGRNELTGSHRYTGAYTPTPDPGDEVTAQRRLYQYDPIGNRQDSTSGTAAALYYCANNLNQYTATHDGTEVCPSPSNPAEAFVYDADGNLTQDGAYTYTWDGENRLIEVVPNSITTFSIKLKFAYDYMGRRVQKQAYYWYGQWVLLSDERFVYDHWNVVEVLNQYGAIRQKYTWGLDLSGWSGSSSTAGIHGAGGIGGLLSVVDVVQFGGASGWMLYDANGNVGQIVQNAAGYPIVAHYEYDAYGTSIVTPGSYAAVNPIRFSTKWLDYELGKDLVEDGEGPYYYGYRYYSPRLGRWLSRDPIAEAGGYNLYRAVNNDPLGNIDALGRQVFEVHSNDDWDASASVGSPTVSSDGRTLTLKASGRAESKFYFLDWTAGIVPVAEGWRKDPDQCCTKMSGMRRYAAQARFHYVVTYDYTLTVQVVDGGSEVAEGVGEAASVLGVTSLYLPGPAGAAVTIGSAVVGFAASVYSQTIDAKLSYRGELDTTMGRRLVGIERIVTHPNLLWQEDFDLRLPGGLTRKPCPAKYDFADGTILVTHIDPPAIQRAKIIADIRRQNP